jgi:DNA-binding transcriptional LysR family regulator
MKIDQLQYFVETAKRQHIGQAARFLNISPSAISHSISALEEEFGHKFFERQGRQIKLTHHGKRLLHHAEFLLAEITRMHLEVSSEHVEPQGHYKIAATHVLCSEILTPSWIELQRQHPRLKSTLQSLRSGEVLFQVDSGDLDLGFCFSPIITPNVDQEILYEGELLICFGKQHPFLKDGNIENLSRHSAIAPLNATGIESCETHPALTKLHVLPNYINYYDSYDVAIHALKFNNLWTLLPDFIAYSHRSEIEVLIPQGWDAQYRIVAIWPKYRVKTYALDKLVESVGAKLKAMTLRH